MSHYAASPKGWDRFIDCQLCGVPHALEIGKLIYESGLTFPDAPDFTTEGCDLLFYGPVHVAWKSKVLGSFLTAIHDIRNHPKRDLMRCDESNQYRLILEIERHSDGTPSYWRDILLAILDRYGNDPSVVFRLIELHGQSVKARRAA